MGNPPYSVGQKSENDNAKNRAYEKLDSKIADTYVSASNTSMNKALYDAYIKAFRWSTDRLDPVNGGIVAFVTNASWLDGNATSGFRKMIAKEFSSIWVFNLRGDQRTSGELSRREGGKIFGSGSRTPISITLLIKNPKVQTEYAAIKYHDIGDYLTREEKLTMVQNFASISNSDIQWNEITPNEEGDWLNQRNDSYESFIEIASKEKGRDTFFDINSNGVVSSRDAWVYNFSQNALAENMTQTAHFYSEQLKTYLAAFEANEKVAVEDIIDNDS